MAQADSAAGPRGKLGSFRKNDVLHRQIPAPAYNTVFTYNRDPKIADVTPISIGYLHHFEFSNAFLLEIERQMCSSATKRPFETLLEEWRQHASRRRLERHLTIDDDGGLDIGVGTALAKI